MAVALADITAGIAANLTAAFPDTQVNQYVLAAPSPPCFEIDAVDGLEVDYDATMQRGFDEYYLTVRGIEPLTGDQTAQVTLHSWLDKTGAASVKAAIEADRTLGGIVSSLRVETAFAKPMVLPSVPNAQYLAAEWRVHIWA